LSTLTDGIDPRSATLFPETPKGADALLPCASVEWVDDPEVAEDVEEDAARGAAADVAVGALLVWARPSETPTTTRRRAAAAAPTQT
jgi:hypothetical protein